MTAQRAPARPAPARPRRTMRVTPGNTSRRVLALASRRLRAAARSRRPHGKAMTPAAGIGFKPQHYHEALASSAAGLWFEVHAENYMVAGGPRLAMLEELRRGHELSLHGVGMSLAGADEPDPDHLAALKRLVDRLEPLLVSEHLAWSRLDGRCFPDLLPVPRTNEVLARCAA